MLPQGLGEARLRAEALKQQSLSPFWKCVATVFIRGVLRGRCGWGTGFMSEASRVLHPASHIRSVEALPWRRRLAG